MRIVTLTGSGYDRGLEHGRALAPDVHETIAALKAHLAAAGHAPEALARRLAGSGLVRTAEDRCPDLWAEVHGIATGSRADIEDVLLLTFLDEVWAFTGGTGCSVVARRRPDGASEIGQTMDLPAWSVGRLLVLRITVPGRPTAAVMSYPGMLGLCGANSAGLGVAVNALSQFALDERGLGVAFVTRHLLTLSTLAAAARFLRSVPHAAGQAYTIAAPDGIATFEAGSHGVLEVTAPDGGACLHTNHPLGRPDTADASSARRLSSIADVLAAGGDLAAALSGDAVLDGERLGDPNATFAAFRAIGTESLVRFIDGADLRAGHDDWTHVSLR